jgi:hypothetical protein
MRTFRPALLSAALALLALAAPAGATTTRTPTPGAEISAYYDSGRWSADIAAMVSGPRPPCAATSPHARRRAVR